MRIRREDVEHVRERTRIEDVVAEHVALRPAGVGSLKGLCPFHEEKTPSFHVRPQVGLFHCFGCGEGGDAITFVEKVDHLGFAEAVERLAGRLGYTVQYENEDGRSASVRRENIGQRQRLVEAHRVASEFYVDQLATSADAMAGRSFLAERGFDRQAATEFTIGFAPRSGEALLRHLRGRGFTEDELVSSGLAGRGQRGLYDRFRGRLLWPIRDLTGDVIGFGARRLFDDDRIEAKYLNTPETAIYKKSQVLYGLDVAKKAIAHTRQVVVVEGYTDVMACQLAGVATAVATCGTSFGEEHIRVVRRLLGDDGSRGAAVIFTFDGDTAGQKAARRAYEEDQRFAAETYIAVAADGMDPCELRQTRGDAAVRDLIAHREPLFRFAIRTALADFDLDAAEGRVAALRHTAPMVAGIRDVSLRPEYVRELAGWLGMEVEAVNRAVRSVGRRGDSRPSSSAPYQAASATATRPPDPRDPIARVEREALECLLQQPHAVPIAEADALADNAFEAPIHRAVHTAIRSAGGMATAVSLSPAAWVERVVEEAPDVVRAMVRQLAVTPLPAEGGEATSRYVTDVVLRLAEIDLSRQISTLRSRVQRADAADPAFQEVFAELLAAESARRSLRDRLSGT